MARLLGGFLHQAVQSQLESLAGEWQAYHDAEVATLHAQLAADRAAAEGAAAPLQEQLQQATSVHSAEAARAFF